MRILLVDDQSIILDGLEALIAQTDEAVVCGRASNGRDALTQAALLLPDVVLMDISMPEMDGIEATRKLRKRHPHMKVLVLSMYNNAEFVRELLDAGAVGYLLKNTGREELREAIATVAAGGRYLAKPVRDTLVAIERDLAAPNTGQAYHVLTRREKEIVLMIAADKTSHQIAETLFLSHATVETHRRNIANKLKIHSAAGLVRYAMERGWILSP